jgi:hypothetical protein
MNNMKAQKSLLKKKEGVTFVVTLIVVAVMSVNLLLFSVMIMRNAFEARREADLMAALYAAEAGANMALRELQQGDDGDIAETPFGGGTYEVDTTVEVLFSTGKVKGRQRTVRLNISNPKGAFSYGVFTDGIQEYQGGGAGESIVVNGDVHSNNATPHINNPSHLIVGSEYSSEAGPDYGFPTLDIEYYQTLAASGGDNHYYTDGDNLGSIVLPQDGGVTLVKLTGVDAGEDISINTSGEGLLIVIGGNVVMIGSTTFTGLLYVNDSNMDGTGLGGNVRIGGNYQVIGSVVSRTANTIHGTNTVTYSSSAFSIDDLQVDIDKVAVYSWQSS